MKITREEDYALAFVTALSRSRQYLPLKTAARQYGLPEMFLKKVARKLKSADILSVKEGRGGGYRLKRPAASISVEEILKAFNKSPLLTTCWHHGKKINCAIYSQCKIRGSWQKISDEFFIRMKKISVAELAQN